MILKTGKWERNEVSLEVYLLLSFLQILPRLLLWRKVFPEGFSAAEILSSGQKDLQRRVDGCNVSLCPSLLEWKPRRSQVSPSVVLASDPERLQVFTEGLTQLLSLWSPCRRCSWVTVLSWLLGVCLWEDSSGGQWILSFPFTCPLVLRQRGRGYPYYKDIIGGVGV